MWIAVNNEKGWLRVHWKYLQEAVFDGVKLRVGFMVERVEQQKAFL
jgi:hypothetical protein